MKLSELSPGDCVTVAKVGDGEMSQSLKRKLLSMGITPNAKVLLLRRAPMGSGLEIDVRGSRLCIRNELADAIEVNK
ncbi:ferrous iron transport protein A [Parashewanella spongiae]|uniref:Ferrous iron transport protein A n=1 Tax=Parashewanella spongiae TaxID=342950 RepID=A0A3A6TVJ5_9GAMM|nr:FeoA family protein [Parashewanella spongiae]MCL1077972.1 ferrous iron transport protein A [Parashewanella spongiae]RJY16903.1 ferrous iron transport protein A [Parashewanella spongiae]